VTAKLLFVTFVYCVKTSRRNHVLKIVSPSGSHTIPVVPYQTLLQYSDKDPLTWAKIAILDQYLSFASMTAGLSGVVNISTVK